MIRLRVYGVPAPQGSKSAFVRGGRAVVTEGGSKTGRQSHAAWRQAVATAARDWQEAHDAPLLDEPVDVGISFIIPKPKSVPKKRYYPTTKPDLDKLVRSVLDAISGVLIRDDAQVVSLKAVKRYNDVDEAPGCHILLSRALAPIGVAS